MSEDDTLIEFPCAFPIKVMGVSTASVRAGIDQAIATQACSSLPVDIQERSSRTGKYTAYTITCTYQSKAELDAMYRAFTAIEGVSMVL
ncbi:MAG: DUF493 domain-containing protein [Pseudomonadota bacterium]